MKPLALGKIRCLQELTNELGVFTIIAVDHREIFVETLGKTLGLEQVSWDTVVAEKIRIARALAPHASAVVLDPRYGAGPIVASGVLPRHTGFGVAYEDSGFSGENAARVTLPLANWSVEAIKRLRGSAVKLQIYYHPDSSAADKQEDLVRQVASECDAHEVPLMLESICYPIHPDQAKSDAAFAAQRPELVLESARRLVPLGIDILKAEFPTDANYETDTSKMHDYCRQLSEIADGVPWVLSSAGVNFPTYQVQVEIACDAGASGFVAGLAIWKEALEVENEGSRERFLKTIAVSRTRVLADTANYRATPWMERVAGRMPQLDDGWYIDYSREP